MSIFRLRSSPSLTLAGALVSVLLPAAAIAQQNTGRWADANDPIAKQLIEAERKWAVLECEPSNVVAEALAEDFVGTSPEGPIYTKKEALAEKPPVKATGCKLLGARVRFYGPDLAMIYGKETSTRTAKGGKTYQSTLIWTDTWLKRNGKWQIIAVQDMTYPKH
jgi:Domain of unknown function (DUF4440)